MYTKKMRLLERLNITNENYESYFNYQVSHTNMEAEFDRVASAHDTELAWNDEQYGRPFTTKEYEEYEDYIHEEF